MYFTQVHEDAIVKYCNTDDWRIKEELYNTLIQPAFSQMVDKIVFTYRFTSLPDIDFSFDTHEEFFEKLKYSLEELATNANYEIIKSKRPQFGDIAYESLYGIGHAMIATDGWWVSASEKDLIIRNRRKLFFLERRLILLARPLRS